MKTVKGIPKIVIYLHPLSKSMPIREKSFFASSSELAGKIAEIKSMESCLILLDIVAPNW